MAETGQRGDLIPDPEAYSVLLRTMLAAVNGQPAAVVAQAGLDIAFGIWALDPTVTRETALAVVTSQIDRIFKRAN